MAKVDVSEIPIDELQSSLSAFERQLLANGYGIYSIDYTQDFSGVLDRERLVRYLCFEGFHSQGDFVSAIQAKNPTILDNTDSVGKHVCTWVCRNEKGNTVRTKIYNKIVSNMEAVDCPNEHLRKTFLHPDVQKRGCTRIEVSLYACNGDDLCTQKANEEIPNALYRVSPGGGQNESVLDFNNELSDNTHCFVLSTKKWLNLAKMPNSCSNHDGAVCGGLLYVAYLYNSGYYHKIVSFNPKQNKWNCVNDQGFLPLINKYKNSSVTTFNEVLYVMGGEQNMQKAQIYNPVSNEWKEVAPMKTGRAGHCAVVLQKQIYVIAGHNSVECYNPSTNQWRRIPSISKPRRFAAAATACDKIVVVGGYSGMSDSMTTESSCEMFDPRTNEWSLVSSPAFPRAACGIVSMDDLIYLFGGKNEQTFMQTVDCFDVKRNKWHEVAIIPDSFKCSHLSASLLKLPRKFLS